MGFPASTSATLAGSSFGRYGDGYLRLSYANSVENIDKALGRIAKAAEAVQGARV